MALTFALWVGFANSEDRGRKWQMTGLASTSLWGSVHASALLCAPSPRKPARSYVLRSVLGLIVFTPHECHFDSRWRVLL